MTGDEKGKDAKHLRPVEREFPICPTGIKGLDEILNGGLPKGRPTLLAGNAGSGKTMAAMEFIVKGAVEYDEPGVFMSFEESGQDLAHKGVKSAHDSCVIFDRVKSRLDNHIKG